MNRVDVIIGMKVVPHGKTTGGPLKYSNAYNDMKAKNQDFLYVAHQHANERNTGNRFLLTDDERCINLTGDYFMCSDFEPYNENKKKV